jgi:hypothetical protein
MFLRSPIRIFTLAILLWTVVAPMSAHADENRWGFGSDLGLTTGTVDDSISTTMPIEIFLSAP